MRCLTRNFGTFPTLNAIEGPELCPPSYAVAGSSQKRYSLLFSG